MNKYSKYSSPTREPQYRAYRCAGCKFIFRANVFRCSLCLSVPTPQSSMADYHRHSSNQKAAKRRKIAGNSRRHRHAVFAVDGRLARAADFRRSGAISNIEKDDQSDICVFHSYHIRLASNLYSVQLLNDRQPSAISAARRSSNRPTTHTLEYFEAGRPSMHLTAVS